MDDHTIPHIPSCTLTHMDFGSEVTKRTVCSPLILGAWDHSILKCSLLYLLGWGQTLRFDLYTLGIFGFVQNGWMFKSFNFAEEHEVRSHAIFGVRTIFR